METTAEKSIAKKTEIQSPEKAKAESNLSKISARYVTDNSKSDAEGKYLDQLQRLQAEFTNYKKRVEKEQAQYRNLGKYDCILSLLPVLDDLDRFVENHDHISDDQSVQGVRLIREKLLDILRKQGLRTIESVGKRFDPRVHEAIAVLENADVAEGEIVEEWQKGYEFDEKLLRPAKVKVAKSNITESDE